MNHKAEPYAGIVCRVAERSLRAERLPLPPARVQRICLRLSAPNPVDAELYARNSTQKGRIEVARGLVRRSYELRSSDPERAWTVGRLACRTARLAEVVAAPGLREDVLAEALANLANLLRIRERYGPADRLLGLAQHFADRGSGDPLVRGLLLRRTASLRRAQGQFAAAIAAASEAEELYTRLGDVRNLALVRRQRGIALAYSGQAEAALQAHYAALEPALKLNDLDLCFSTLHSIVLCFEALGQPRFALREMIRAEPLYARGASPFKLLGARWVRGRLLAATGGLSAARQDLEEAKAGFVERGLHYDAALIGLDLGLVYSKLGENWKLAQMAREMWDVFTAKKIPREAAASLMLFAEAAQKWAANTRFIEGIQAELAPIRRATGR